MMRDDDKQTEKLVQDRVRKMLEPIEKSLTMAHDRVNFAGSAFDPKADQAAQRAGLDIAVVLISSVISMTESLRIIARVLEADADRDSADGERG